MQNSASAKNPSCAGCGNDTPAIGYLYDGKFWCHGCHPSYRPAAASPASPLPAEVEEVVSGLEEEERRLSGHSLDFGSADAGIAANVAANAAALIRSLSAQLETVKGQDGDRGLWRFWCTKATTLQSELDKARAEVARMREAIREAQHHSGQFWQGTRDHGWVRDAYRKMREALFRALGEDGR